MGGLVGNEEASNFVCMTCKHVLNSSIEDVLPHFVEHEYTTYICVIHEIELSRLCLNSTIGGSAGTRHHILA